MSDPSPAGPSRNANQVEQSRRPSGSRKTSSKDAKPSYITRTGFPLLATSSSFVQDISQEVTALLESFVQAWVTAIEQFDSIEESADLPSPFAIFRQVYVERGWHFYQMYWSEHFQTRLKIYHSFVRVLTDSLRPLVSLIGTTEDDLLKLDEILVEKVPATEVLKAIGVLFALKLIQSTTAISTSDTSFRHSEPRIPIEADLYHVLYALPSITRVSKALGGSENRSGLQPTDDVVFVLKDMMGDSQVHNAVQMTESERDGYDTETSLDENDEREGVSKTVFDVLLPTTYEARPALVNIGLSTKAEMEKARGIWGRLKSSETAKDGMGLSRADLMRNLVRQRLELPLRASKEDGVDSASQSLTMDEFKIDKRGHSKDSFPVTVPPGDQAEQNLQECRDEVAQQEEVYQASKKQRFNNVDMTSLLPTSVDGTSRAESFTTPIEPADLQSILAAARGKVVQAMRKHMRGSE